MKRIAGVIGLACLLAACASAPPAPSGKTDCVPAALGDSTLFLRGSINAWAALDESAFQYHCDAYYLNVEANVSHDFKIADAQWSDARSFGAAVGASGQIQTDVPYAAVSNTDPGGTANLRYAFSGEHTIRVAFADGRPLITIGAKRFADPNAKTVTDPVALSVRFDSRALEHKTPFGAVTPGQTVQFALSALPGIDTATLVIEGRRLEGNQELLEYSELARVPMHVGLAGQWQAEYSFAAMGVYGYWFELRIGATRYAYQNNREAIFWTREKGSGGIGAIAHLPEQTASIRRYRQTVYSADFHVPDWAPDIVYYYIFPERFRNGDRNNDPKPGPRSFRDQSLEVHNNWNDAPWRNGSGDGSDAIYSNDFYGGDIQGIIDKLDYIQALGANTLYITPLFLASSNHKYDTADYTQIDPGFGRNEDFSRLTAAAAARGMRVIPDTSLNHTGSDSIYFDRYGKYPPLGAFDGGHIQADSPYADWYRFDATQSDPERQYRGWTGVRDLPELNKDSPSFRRFAYGAADSIMLRWLDRGAAGWRMDVAPWVPDDFWREWRAAIRAHRADALTVAETWFDASKYLLGDMFDSTMNYIFRNTVLEYAAGGDARRLYGNIEQMREAYPPQALYALMNLLSTHDQARSLHVLEDPGEEVRSAPSANARQRFKLAVLLQMSFPGSPTVYYGDEVGLSGGDDPLNRAAYPWPDLGGQPDAEMLAEFKRLIAMRNAHAVLRRGTLEAPAYIDQHVIVWWRRLGDELALVATNNSAQARELSLRLPANTPVTKFTPLLETGEITVLDAQIKITVPARYGTVLIGSVQAPARH